MLWDHQAAQGRAIDQDDSGHYPVRIGDGLGSEPGSPSPSAPKGQGAPRRPVLARELDPVPQRPQRLALAKVLARHYGQKEQEQRFRCS